MGESNKTTGAVNTYVLSDCGKYYNVTFRNSDKVGMFKWLKITTGKKSGN